MPHQDREDQAASLISPVSLTKFSSIDGYATTQVIVHVIEGSSCPHYSCVPHDIDMRNDISQKHALRAPPFHAPFLPPAGRSATVCTLQGEASASRKAAAEAIETIWWGLHPRR
eukprot:2278058-Prymnesium_polylepis.2